MVLASCGRSEGVRLVRLRREDDEGEEDLYLATKSHT